MNKHDNTNRFSENIFFLGQMDHFGRKNDASYNFGSTLRIFLKVCTVKKGPKVHENCINGFYKKILI